MKNRISLGNINFKIFLISLFIFSIKWFFSYYNYGIENIFFKIIFNPSGDYSYYPFVHQLSSLKFNEGYSNLFSNLNLIGFPFFVSLVHAIFYNIFNLYIFLILELICIFIFLKIFFHIFKLLKFSNSICILISLFIFSLPNIFNILNTYDIPYILHLKQLYSGFYSLRFPRPLVTNLFLFSFLLFSIKFYLDTNEENKRKFLLISGFFLGALFNSFFYFFLVCIILTIVLITFEYRKSIFKKENLFFYLKFVTIIFVVSLPFLVQILLIEQDYLARVGSFSLEKSTKIFLTKHLIKGFLKPEFIIILITNIIFFFINIKLKSDYRKFLIFFWLLFFSSTLTPFIYLIFMNRVTFFGNFTFMIALFSLLLLKVNFIIFLISIKNYIKFNIYIKRIVVFSSIFILVSINSIYFFQTSRVDSLSSGEHFNPKNRKTFRNDFIDVILFLKKNTKGEHELLLTNDVHTQLWWIFSNKKKYYFPYVFFVALNDNMIEIQLINAFKYLNLKNEDFINFLNQNKITDWRVVNTNNYFFLGHLKYQTNYLTKFSNINDYPENTKKFINKKSIHHTNQVILPKNELIRLREKFRITNKNKNLEPDVIVLAKYDILSKNLNLIKNFSKAFENQNFVILLKK